ncbi:MAG: response regulator [Planctomycetota bacterium]
MPRVVLLDDEVRLLGTLARFLELRGFEVIRGTSFAAIQEHLQPGGFDVLVSDIFMPDFDGLQVLHEVATVRGCQEPVILITGQPDLETAAEAVRSGAFDYVRKPVTKDRLIEVVDRGIRYVQLLRERDSARQREMQLLKNLAEIGESASVLSHEIKTPISGLRHALSAVGSELGVEHGVLIDELVESLARIERLLGETLSFAKPIEPSVRMVTLQHVVDAALHECRSLDLFADMQVDVQVPAGLQVELDAQLFVDVFSNLLRNAAEACDGKGQISILAARCISQVPPSAAGDVLPVAGSFDSQPVDSQSFDSQPGETRAAGASRAACLRIDVCDDGPGVPANMRAGLFKPFQSSKAQGTGIGLAMTRKIVEAHGGQMELVDGGDVAICEGGLPDAGTSRATGCCFRIELPGDAVFEVEG